MNHEDLVAIEFARITKDFGCLFEAPVRKPSGMGEGTLTFNTGTAFCAADWWDRGGIFTLFLGRCWDIGGRSFVSEFPVEEMVQHAKVRPSGGRDVEVQIREQFEILSRHGISWLRGDFSQEAFIRHKVRVRAEGPGSSTGATVAASLKPLFPASTTRLLLMTVQDGVLFHCIIAEENGTHRVVWVLSDVFESAHVNGPQRGERDRTAFVEPPGVRVWAGC
jgi:hypothetical protein